MTTAADGRRRGVTAFFDDPAAAQKAVDDLVAAGVDRHRIGLVGGGLAPEAFEAVPSRDRTIWDTVKGLFMADEDRHAYGEGLRRGGVLLSVATAGDDARVAEVLDREGAVDMDARQGDWELEGWDPVRASADLRALSGAAPGMEAPPAGLPDAAVRAAVEPAAAVGPAFAAGEARAVRDGAKPGRLRAYVEARDGDEPAR